MNLNEFMESLYNRHGRLTPKIVLEAARPIDSPIHSYVFGLDEAQAAEAYYLDRAHRLIQRVRVQYPPQPAAERTFVRQFVAVPDNTEHYRYEPREVLAQRPDLLAEARQEAVRRLKSAEAAIDELDMIAIGAPASPNIKLAKASVRQAVDSLSDDE